MDEPIRSHPRPGFRFSVTDGIVLLAAMSATPSLVEAGGRPGWLPIYIVSHFFLFCNVFRVPRRLELIWSGIFILLAATLAAYDTNVGDLMIFQLPITMLVILKSLLDPRYHGILSRQLHQRTRHEQHYSGGAGESS